MKENGLIRIGNAGGYWGDDPHALRRQVLGPLDLDYISIDYLAEVTMSILQKQKGRDPSAGYARDFVTQIEPLLEQVLLRRIRIITNAGGVNPEACAAALAAVARAKGLKLRIAVVEGDDVAPRLSALMGEGIDLRNLETGAPFRHANQALAANVYFGAMPVAEALSFDPHIVITGRVTDTGITLAPLIHEFGWGPADWNLLAAGIVAGHLIECGAQATGGNFTDWKKVPSSTIWAFPSWNAGATAASLSPSTPAAAVWSPARPCGNSCSTRWANRAATSPRMSSPTSPASGWSRTAPTGCGSPGSRGARPRSS